MNHQTVSRITVRDVARLAGVSSATVSYVINNGPKHVSEDTRFRVQQAIAQLNYQPNAIARSLVTTKTMTVGLIIPDILNVVAGTAASGIEEILHSHGYDVILGNTREEPERERSLLEKMSGRRIDGLVLMPTPANYGQLFHLVDAGMSVVLLDRLIEGLSADSVLFDNENGAYLAIRHLIELGHKRIGFINIPTSIAPGVERVQGYKAALLEAHIPFDPNLVRETDYMVEGVGAEKARELLALLSPPTALFVTSNKLMLGVLRVINNSGLHMPEHIAVCGFGDIPLYPVIKPSITAVATDLTRFASVAAEMLLERMEGRYSGARRIVRIPCTLEVRESTRSSEHSPVHSAGWAAQSGQQM